MAKEKKSSWGKSLHIDLFGCEQKTFRKNSLKKFCRLLCDEIGMKPHGVARVKRFGQGKLRGNSALQFIKTSSIAIHTDDFQKRAFIDIFSCKDFNELSAKAFSKKYFLAKKSKASILMRG